MRHVVNSVTGIPIEILFGALGALISAFAIVIWSIGRSALGEIREIRTEQMKRGRQMTGVQTVLTMLAQKAGIPYNPEL